MPPVQLVASTNLSLSSACVLQQDTAMLRQAASQAAAAHLPKAGLADVAVQQLCSKFVTLNCCTGAG